MCEDKHRHDKEDRQDTEHEHETTVKRTVAKAEIVELWSSSPSTSSWSNWFPAVLSTLGHVALPRVAINPCEQ